MDRVRSGWRFHPGMPVEFTRFPAPGGEWHVIGPAARLVSGATVDAEQFNGVTGRTKFVPVVVGEVVVERVVRHRASGPARYVIARFVRADKEV